MTGTEGKWGRGEGRGRCVCVYGVYRAGGRRGHVRVGRGCGATEEGVGRGRPLQRLAPVEIEIGFCFGREWVVREGTTLR